MLLRSGSSCLRKEGMLEEQAETMDNRPKQVRLSLACGFFLVIVLLSCNDLEVILAATPLEIIPVESALPHATRVIEEPSEHQGISPSCRAEVKKLCHGVRPGGGRIKKCIADNESKLSPACQKAVQERLEKERSKKQ